jgi:hypothetical protein
MSPTPDEVHVTAEILPTTISTSDSDAGTDAIYEKHVQNDNGEAIAPNASLESASTAAVPSVPLGASAPVSSNASMVPNSKAVSTSGSNLTVDQAREIMGRWGSTGKLSRQDFDVLLVLLKDHENLREKVSKLKELLGRSAIAQREGKATQRRLDSALQEIERLKSRIDKLSSRPTHMDLLADFEANFDRALLSVGQAGGQNTASSATAAANKASTTMTTSHDILATVDQPAPLLDGLLMQELDEYKQRLYKLEKLNTTLSHRAAHLEREARDIQRERDGLANKVSHLELEKKMAVMEADHAKRMMQEKAASLTEMQMEIDLVTKASLNANARAAQGAALMKTVKTDREHAHLLEDQVKALQEWALASSAAKNLAQERVKMLEQKLSALQAQEGDDCPKSGTSQNERVLSAHTGSMVVGAGDVSIKLVALDDDMVRSVRFTDRVVMRWQFEIKSSLDDPDIRFSVVKGKCVTKAEQKRAEALLKERSVKSGGEGEIENAFDYQRSCTVLWSNIHSWIRPRTIRYSLEAVVISESD